MAIYKICPECSKEYRARSQTTKTCSSICGHAQQAKKMLGHKIFSDTHGSKNPRWIGGRIFDKDGYYMVYSPTHPNKNAIGYVREHRLVMEKHLGRYLEAGEVVHHKNGIITDNTIKNLEVLAKAEHDRQSILIRKRDKRGRVLAHQEVL